MTACACGRVCVYTRVIEESAFLFSCCRIREPGKEYGYIISTFYINNLPGARLAVCVCVCLCACVLASRRSAECILCLYMHIIHYMQ